MKGVLRTGIAGYGVVGKRRQEFVNRREDMQITAVSNVDEVLKIALTKELKPVEWIEVENLPKSKTGEKPVTGSTH